MKSLSMAILFFLILGLSPFFLHAQTIDQWLERSTTGSPKEQIEALLQLNIIYQSRQLDTALLFANSAKTKAKALASDSLLGVSHCRLATTFYYQRQADSLLFHAQRGISIAKQQGYARMEAFCHKLAAIAQRDLGDFSAALTSNKQALAISKTLQDSTEVAGTLSNIGRAHQELGQYDEALTYLLRAADMFQILVDSNGLSLSKAQIGSLYMDLEQPEKARTYLKEAIQITNSAQHTIRYADLLNTLGAIYHEHLQQLDSAEYCFRESLRFFEKIGDQQGRAQCHNNLGNLARDRGQQSTALAQLHQANRIVAAANWLPKLAHNLKDLGLAHERFGQLDSTIHYLLAAETLTQQADMPRKRLDILERLYMYYKANGPAQKALAYHEIYIKQRQIVDDSALQKKIAQLEIQYNTAQQARENEQLQHQATLQRSRNTFLMTLLAMILALAIIGGIHLWTRRKQAQQKLALQQQLHQQETARLDRELEFRNQQLSSHALHMTQKNKALLSVKSTINQLVKKSQGELRSELRKLLKQIDFNIQADEDWEVFRLYFEQTNQGFYQKLAIVNSDLTPTELKLCALIRLNMNIKETAAILNIAPTSVKTARHRLRKKLALAPGEDLTSFIQQVA